MIFGGVAHLGNTQAGVLYPVRLLFAGFGTNRAIDLMIATHLVALALGMRWFARRLGLRPPAGLVIGIGAVLNGASLVKATQFEQFLVLAGRRSCLVAVHAVITSNRPWRMVPVLALVGAAVLSAGHPQLIYLVGSFTLCITVALFIGTRSWRRLGPLAAGGVLAAAIGSLQLLATAAAYGPSALSDARRNADLARADWTLEPGRVLAALLGTVRNIGPDNFMGAFEIIASVGVVVVFLASIGLVAAPADARADADSRSSCSRVG